MDHDGTLLFCDCQVGAGESHHREVLAGANGRLEIHDRRHGTHHTLNLTVQQLVELLDPRGTSYQAVGSAR